MMALYSHGPCNYCVFDLFYCVIYFIVLYFDVLWCVMIIESVDINFFVIYHRGMHLRLNAYINIVRINDCLLFGMRGALLIIILLE